MARRRRKKSLVPRIVLVVSFAGLSFPALKLTTYPPGKILALAGALLVAFAVSLGFSAALRYWRGRRSGSDRDGLGTNQPFEGPDQQDDSGSFQDLLRRMSQQQPAQAPGSWSLELLRKLEWRRFEELCAAYFRMLGFRAELNRFGRDEGIDIQLFAAGQEQPAILVQCKAWSSEPIGVSIVREHYGVMARKKVPEGILLTTGSFTSDAMAFPEGSELHLWDGSEFLRKILGLPEDQQRELLKIATKGDFATPTCPSCGIKMVWRTPKSGAHPFWGCTNFPKCRNVLYQAT